MVKRIPLDNVCAKKIPTLSSQYDGLIDYVDISSVDNAEKRIVSMQCVSAKEAPSRAKQLLEVGDILVSTVRPNLNAVAMVERQTDNLLVGSTGYCVLRCNDSIDKRYVFHFCQSPYFINDMTSQAAGASYPAVSSGIVKSSTIPDHPIEKQKLIADCLDKVSELIALRKEQLAKLDQLVKSRFIELIQSNNPRYVKLKDVVEEGRIITYGIVKPGEHTEGGVPIIKVKDFPNGTILMNDMLLASPEIESKYERSRVKEGDLLFSIRGSVGRTAFVPKSLIGANITQDTARVSVGTDFNPHYIRAALGFDSVQKEINEHVRGVAVRGISLAELREIGIPVLEKKTQDEFGRFVEQTDKSKLAIQQSLEKLELLKKSLMQEYFG